MRLMLPIMSFSLAIACSGSGEFSGQTAGSKAAERDKAATDTPEDDDDEEGEATTIQIGKESGGEDKAATDATTSSKAPATAIVQGSFTAWAEPSNPAPRQNYWIHVEIKLPSNISNYTQSDLSGRLTGTDGYTRGIGRDSQGVEGNAPPWAKLVRPADRFELQSGLAKVSIFVPGAASLVRDTIQIHSNLLDESQSLAIVFR